MEIVFASGKGGTGKTLLSSNFVYFMGKERAVSVDADVEAPDLVIALGGIERKVKEREIFESEKAIIDYNKCLGESCLKCLGVCRFKAIEVKDKLLHILVENCEGCGACRIVCPASAISLTTFRTGKICVADTKYGGLVVTGDLEIGGRNTGHLVEIARDEARRHSAGRHIIIDAAAGIGCPVVSSLVGSDILVIVLEPTEQSLQGGTRILEMTKRMNIKRKFAIINKYDLNPSFAKEIENILPIEVIGKIPYDKKVVDAYSHMVPVLKKYPETKASRAIQNAFEVLEGELR